jgi:hypothetical protein
MKAKHLQEILNIALDVEFLGGRDPDVMRCCEHELGDDQCGLTVLAGWEMKFYYLFEVDDTRKKPLYSLEVYQATGRRAPIYIGSSESLHELLSEGTEAERKRMWGYSDDQ